MMRQDRVQKECHYSRLAYNLKDSLNSAEKVEQLNFLEAKYQNVKKEKEITNLQKANQENEFVIRRKNGTIVGAVVLLILLLALSGNHISLLQEQATADTERKSPAAGTDR